MILRIALRYLFGNRGHKVVNVISAVSMSGVAVATMAIVVVLSVFNGFSDLARRHLSAIDPDIKISPLNSKTFNGDSIAEAVAALPMVKAAAPVLQERALIVANDVQKAIKIKGLSESGSAVCEFDKLIIDGVYTQYFDSIPAIQIAVGVAMETGLRPSTLALSDIYMPRRTARINPANPSTAFKTFRPVVSGVFSVDQPEYDADYVFAPIGLVRDILEYDEGEASAVEVALEAGANPQKVIASLEEMLSTENVQILDREQQQADTFRMIAVEKWITFLMLVFILIIACFNIVSTISLIVIEKRHDMSTLRALGARKSSVTSIFVMVAWLITAIGGFAGTVIGLILSLVQQHFGVIKLGGDPGALSIDVYPVHVQAADIALVVFTIVVTGLLIAQCARIFTRKL